MNNDVAKLIYTTSTEDDDGFSSGEVETKIEVFVEKKSITRTEFYSAMQAGMKPQIVFSLRLEDWELSKHEVDGKVKYAEKVEYDGNAYDIIRTYEVGQTIELICG
jgi:SPP1 family predicted phage head-tail adaptor